jgi:hypothetical protein
MTRAVVGLLALCGLCFGADKVAVTVLSESMCPNCQQFLSSDLDPALGATGVWDVVALNYVPWGNAYCEIPQCPPPTPGHYDASVRKCWNAACIGASPPSGCFNLDKQVSAAVVCVSVALFF